jgi:putative NIF3 family GTP cyclohydrolase 1 type 2
MADWIADEAIEALIVHRPWGLPERLPGDPGILAYHLAFDERLTIGLNPILAARLGMESIEPLGEKQGRPIGMIGNVPEQRLEEFGALLGRTLETEVSLRGGDRPVRRAALVGAMWPELILDARRRGADVYVTGTLRPHALAAVAEAGIAVAVVGHRAPELWGLRTLGRSIAEAFPAIRVVVREERTRPDRQGARNPLAGRGEGGFAGG